MLPRCCSNPDTRLAHEGPAAIGTTFTCQSPRGIKLCGIHLRGNCNREDPLYETE